MLRDNNYPAIQELFSASHPSIPFFVASVIGLVLILLPVMLRRENKFPVQGRVLSISTSQILILKLVLITGGSQGLGESMAICLAKKGADIVIVSRSEEKLKAALRKVEV